MRAILRFWLLLSLLLSATAIAQTEKKPKINQVSFSGNQSFDKDRLLRLMLSRSAGLFKSSYYFPEVLADDIVNIVAFYQQQGFLEATAESHVDLDSLAGEVDIEIEVTEGELTRVEGIAVFGNSVFADSVLLREIKLQRGGPFKGNRVQEGLLAIVSLYANHGYLNATARPEVRLNAPAHLAVVDITVSEGPQFTVGQIRPQGQLRTRTRVLRRELSFSEGDIVDYSRLLRSQRSLYLTGLFESVFIRPVEPIDRDSMTRDILIELKEKPSSEFNVSVGYGSIEKLQGRIELLTNNLAGTARKAGVSVAASFIRRRAELSFTEPWTFRSRWQTDLNLFVEYLEEPSYDLDRIGGRLTLGRKFRHGTSASLSYRFEDLNLKHIRIDRSEVEPDVTISSLILSLSYDGRDNLFDPTSGVLLEWTNELAGAFLQGTNTFARSTLRGRLFTPIGRSAILGSAFEIGWIDRLGSSEPIPLNERFYAGDPNALRAFDYQMVGPLDVDRDPLGGNLKLVFNVAELRLALYKLIGGAMFIDVGNVWSMPSDFRLKDLRLSPGFGLRANTPIGIVRLDLGFNVDPKDQESNHKLYFSMGQAF